MATNLLLGYPDIFFKTSTALSTSHAYSSTYPLSSMFHGGRARYAELAAAAQFTNYIDCTMDANPSAPQFLFIGRAKLLKACGVESVVLRTRSSSGVRWDYPSSISGLQYWMDSGRNVVRSATTGSKALNTITERSSNAIVGTATASVYHSEMSTKSNWLQYSEEFNTAPWAVTRCTITANQTTNPINLADATADKMTEDNTTNSRWVAQTGVTGFVSGRSYRFSVYAKKINRDHIWLQISGTAFPANPTAWFNLNTGAVGSVSGGPTSSITFIGDGWYKCTMTASAGADGTTGFYIGPANADAATSYTATSQDTTYLFGAQVSRTADDTTYLPTTIMRRHAGVNSNRALCFVEDAEIDFGNPAALSITGDISIFCAVAPAFNNANNRYLIDHESLNANGLALYRDGATNKLIFRTNQAGANTALTATAAMSNSVFNRVGVVRSGGTATHYLDGATNGSGAISNPVAPTTNFFLGDNAANSGWNGYICEVLIYNRALSAGEITNVDEYLNQRWNGASSSVLLSIHDIQSRTFDGPNAEDILVLQTMNAYTHWRLEFDTENSSVRRCGHVFVGAGMDLGKDPIFGREVKMKLERHDNKFLRRHYAMEWLGITDANRQAFETNIGQFIDAHNVVLVPLVNLDVIIPGLEVVECEIDQYLFDPTEMTKNRLRMELIESI